MFGPISPTVKNLLTQANTWRRAQSFNAVNNTFTQENLGTTTVTAARYENLTQATVGAQQASPAIEWHGHGWKTTSTAASQNVSFREYVLPVQGTTSPSAIWKLQSSINGASYVDRLEMLSTAFDGVDFPQLRVTGAIKSIVNNSSTIGTLQSFDLVNPSGNRINMTATFGSTIKWGIQATDNGATVYKAAGSGAVHYFQVGSNIESTFDIIQIYSGGVYNYGGSFNSGRVTAGSAAPSTCPAYLNSYGSFALRGSYKTANATLNENETMVYVDAAGNAICSGTPSVSTCSSYTASGQATCISHLPCSWTAAVTESCSAYGGVDLSTCESVTGCTFDQTSCAGPTDEASCIAQDDTYGGSCAWNVCSGFTDTASCNAQSGCSATVDGDCTAFNDGGGDGTACAAQSECSYDSGTGVCSGTYFTSCNGGYCTGNYYNGSCSGTHEITPAACTGTVLCGSYMSSGACAAETGCAWTTGVVITLPSSSVANDGNTSRLYSIVNIGASGTVTVVPTSGGTIPDTILGYGSGVVLNATNERVMLHHHNVQSTCNAFNASQSACEAATGCSWSPAVVCADLMDESACNAYSGSGCSWNGSSCSGAGSSSTCNGTYTSSKPWVIHQLSN